MIRSRPRRRLVLALLAALVPVAAFSGEEGGIHIYVASKSYDVTVAPVTEASRDAESSLLYQRTSTAVPWEILGPCRKTVLPNGDVRFTRNVEVERDGTYHYTTRPVVGGEVDLPPALDDPSQAVVVVDTLPPTAELLLPPEGGEVMPGENVALSWVVSDENLPENPAAIGYSTDGGKSWTMIDRDLPAEGGSQWRAPADLGGPAVIRLAAVDRAGNVGRALRQVALGAPVRPTREPEQIASTPPPERITPAPSPTIEETVITTEEELPPERLRDPNRSWLYYLMAVNLMRQNKPADALQYYWLSVKEDPDFINAWADIALAYIDLGAYRTARDIALQTRDRDPERIDLLHLMGETYHAEGMALLGEARTADERMRAKGLIDEAVAWYGQALEKASEEWRLAEQAASFYRLGEVCYYVNMDRDGAREYWKKILTLHSPTPNPDLLLWSSAKDRPKERKRHERYTYQRVSLDAWQNWARGYLEQMDARERAGIVDLMPAQRITATGPIHSLSYAGNEMNPGRDDGRSLFSLPAQLGVDGDAAACVGTAGPGPIAGGNTVNFPAHMNRRPITEGYSFYAREEGKPGSAQPAPAGRGGKRSVFSGSERRVAPPPDPYAFPQRGRGQAAWNNLQPYGSQPIRDW